MSNLNTQGQYAMFAKPKEVSRSLVTSVGEVYSSMACTDSRIGALQASQLEVEPYLSQPAEGELGTLRERLAKLEAVYSEKLKVKET